MDQSCHFEVYTGEFRREKMLDSDTLPLFSPFKLPDQETLLAGEIMRQNGAFLEKIDEAS